MSCSGRNLTQIDGRAEVNPQDLLATRAPRILKFKRKTEIVYPPNLSKAYHLELWGYWMSLSMEWDLEPQMDVPQIIAVDITVQQPPPY